MLRYNSKFEHSERTQGGKGNRVNEPSFILSNFINSQKMYYNPSTIKKMQFFIISKT